MLCSGTSLLLPLSCISLPSISASLVFLFHFHSLPFLSLPFFYLCSIADCQYLPIQLKNLTSILFLRLETLSALPFIKEKTILMMKYSKNFQRYSGWNLFFNSSNRGLPGDFSNNSLNSSFAFSVFPFSE